MEVTPGDEAGPGHENGNGRGNGARHSYIDELTREPQEPQIEPSAARVSQVSHARTPKWAPRLVLLLCALLTLATLLLMLFPTVLWPAHPGRERHQEIDEHFGVAVSMACFLPLVLAWLSHTLINKRAFWDHIRPCFPELDDPTLREARDVAEASWTYEFERAHSNLARAEVFAGLWGIMTSMGMVGAVIFLIPPFHDVATPFGTRPNVLACGLLGATVTSFLLDLARLSLRTSSDDATKRMFADALRTLILAMVTTMLVMLMAPVIGPEWLQHIGERTSETALHALGLGAGVAIVGPAVYEWSRERLASAFGIEKKRREVGTPLDKLDDIGWGDIARLAEEGIETVETLVNTPVARLFLCTRFSLQRIVRWHDFGLLITRVGAVSAADLRSRWGLRGSVEVRRIMSDADSSSRETLRNIFQKAMRVDGEAEAELVLRQIACDDRVVLVEVLRKTRIKGHFRPGPGASC